MLWTIAVILVMLWLTGLVSGYAMGLFIHVLFAAAVALLVVSLSQEVTMNRKLRQVLDSRGQKPDYKRKRRKIVMDKPIPAAGIIGLSE